MEYWEAHLVVKQKWRNNPRVPLVLELSVPENLWNERHDKYTKMMRHRNFINRRIAPVPPKTRSFPFFPSVVVIMRSVWGGLLTKDALTTLCSNTIIIPTSTRVDCMLEVGCVAFDSFCFFLMSRRHILYMHVMMQAFKRQNDDFWYYYMVW
jgi:hypothetical protein